MLSGLCRRPIIEKTRHEIWHDGHLWEVDVFEGDNAGLVLAEAELDDLCEPVSLPPWVGPEVTRDNRNLELAKHPIARSEMPLARALQVEL